MTIARTYRIAIGVAVVVGGIESAPRARCLYISFARMRLPTCHYYTLRYILPPTQSIYQPAITVNIININMPATWGIVESNRLLQDNISYGRNQ